MIKKYKEKIVTLKCWFIRLRYGSQLYYIKPWYYKDSSGEYKDKLWSILQSGNNYYRYVGKNLYFNITYKKCYDKRRTKIY